MSFIRNLNLLIFHGFIQALFVFDPWVGFLQIFSWFLGNLFSCLSSGSCRLEASSRTWTRSLGECWNFKKKINQLLKKATNKWAIYIIYTDYSHNLNTKHFYWIHLNKLAFRKVTWLWGCKNHLNTFKLTLKSGVFRGWEKV